MKPVILVGGGGHARVSVDALLLQKVKILGFVDPNQKEMTVAGRKIRYLGIDETLLDKKFSRNHLLVNGIGSVGDPRFRKQIFEKFRSSGYSFAGVIHPSAIIAKDVQLEEGAQVMAGSVIQAGTKIGKNVIINTHVSIDHDCEIADHVHIAPGAILCGGVRVGEGAHVGCGAVIIQGVSVEPYVLIRSNELVTRK